LKLVVHLFSKGNEAGAVKTKAMKTLIDTWANAIKEAVKAADSASVIEDGGTCNLDSVVIDFTGWRQTAIRTVAEKAGVEIGDKLSSWMWKGSCFVNIPTNGQGNNNTRMVEAAVKKLKELGLPASTYYQMD
jgi:uncharacterized protein YqgV (UPF0045/DUF77 family)